MKTAARVAELFGLDPIIVLKANREEWLMRIAALLVVRADEKERARRNKT